jgi:hypothetical protein
MNNFFDNHRFSLLLKRQWNENYFIFLMGIVIFISITTILYTLNIDKNTDYLLNKDIQVAMFLIGFFSGGTLFANYLFKDFGNTTQSISFLMLPASHFEKLMSGIFYALIVFPLTYFVVFGLVDSVIVAYANSMSVKVNNQILYITIFNDNHEYSSGIFIWICVQVFSIVGAIYFGRMSYIKTAFTGFILLAIIGLWQYLLYKGLVEQDKDINYSVDFNEDNRKNLSAAFNFILMASHFAFNFVLAPFLAVVAYFKLKEKEV